MPWSLGRPIISRTDHPSEEVNAGHEAGGGVIVVGRTYVAQYTSGWGQAQTKHGCLVAVNQKGFVVLEVNDKHRLGPKVCIPLKVQEVKRGHRWTMGRYTSYIH
jgi:hypothetical protein